MNNDLGQVRLCAPMRAKERELRKFLSVQRNRPLRQGERKRMVADFVRYIEGLISIFRLTEKLDAAGDTMSRIFHLCRESKERLDPKAMENFKNWIINFDVWGSFLPLTAQSWDV